MTLRQSSAEEFLALAEDADRQVVRSKDESERERWQDIARGYRELAEAARKHLKRSEQTTK